LVETAVPGIEEQADVGLVEHAGEFFNGARELLLIEIDAELDLEAEGLERLRHIGGVIAGIAQRSRLRVGGIADHQRDAPFRARIRRPQRQQQASDREALDYSGQTGQHGYPLFANRMRDGSKYPLHTRVGPNPSDLTSHPASYLSSSTRQRFGQSSVRPASMAAGCRGYLSRYRRAPPRGALRPARRLP
jgi:hypothetical protein